MAFKVHVDDNFHYMDESERYEKGTYDSYDSAVAACKKIVDDNLLAAYKPGMSAKKLYEGYVCFGDDPWITPTPEESEDFSAWEYAKKRCDELCGRGDVVDADPEAAGENQAPSKSFQQSADKTANAIVAAFNKLPESPNPLVKDFKERQITSKVSAMFKSDGAESRNDRGVSKNASPDPTERIAREVLHNLKERTIHSDQELKAIKKNRKYVEVSRDQVSNSYFGSREKESVLGAAWKMWKQGAPVISGDLAAKLLILMFACLIAYTLYVESGIGERYEYYDGDGYAVREDKKTKDVCYMPDTAQAMARARIDGLVPCQ